MKKILLLFLLFATHHISACTGIRLTADDGASVSGRTIEFGEALDTKVAVIPKNYTFTGKAPKGDGLVYHSKYAAVGIYCFDYQVLMDGINEMGLVAASFYFPGYANYSDITEENQSKALSPVEFPNWILTQFATLEEVKAALSSVVIGPTVTKGWGETPPPFHYIVYDKSGDSLVIEPLDGKLVVYESKIGTITNSPTFDWHMTNLRNYINLTTFDAKPITLRGVELAPFGQGSGMVGLPGDFTPPSRFVRAAIFSSTATPSQDSQSAVYQAFHILNQFDIPIGIVNQKVDGIVKTDYTQLTSVKDPKELRYYFKTYQDQTIQFIDLNHFDLNAKNIKSKGTQGRQLSVDISSYLSNSMESVTTHNPPRTPSQ